MAFGDLARQDDYAAMGTPEDYYVPEGEAPNKTQRILSAIGQGLKDWVETPGRALRGETTPEDAYQWGPATAFGMIAGSKLPGGAAGSGMTKLPASKPAFFAPTEAGSAAPKTLFDYSRIHEVPDVPQFDLPRYTPKHGVSERVQDLVKNKDVERQMLEYFEKGKNINAETFYYNEPLREAFVAELGKKQGDPSFRRYMEYVGGSSPRSKVEENARNASYYYVLDKQGKPLPPKNEAPYGHMAQNLHRQNAENIRSGANIDVLNNPKPPSFIENLTGNFMPATVDAHAFKLPGMLSRDPRFLAGSMTLEKGAPPINPAKMFASGDLKIKDALERPVFWSAQPNRNEYAAMEQYYKHLARESGLATGQGQAAGWGGGAEVTGLGSVAGDPFMRSVEKRANITAAKRGITPAEALSRMMRGKEPLLAIPPAAVFGTLAAQDTYK